MTVDELLVELHKKKKKLQENYKQIAELEAKLNQVPAPK